MELTTMQLYWIIKLDSFGNVSFFFAVLTGLATIISIIGLLFSLFSEDFKEYLSNWKRVIKYVVMPIFILFLSVAVFLPTTKEMAAIIVIPKIINNEKVQELPQRLLDLGMEWIDELKPKNNQE